MILFFTPYNLSLPSSLITFFSFNLFSNYFTAIGHKYLIAYKHNFYFAAFLEPENADINQIFLSSFARYPHILHKNLEQLFVNFGNS